MRRQDALDQIDKVFTQAQAAISVTDAALMKALSNGKLFELFSLSEVLKDLDARGCVIAFQGTSLKFKAAPGQIKLSDPHFRVVLPYGETLRLFVDIEFRTLGAKSLSTFDDSCMHELDIVITSETSGYPSHEDIWFAAECKSTAKFKKSILKEILGVRRELGYLGRDTPSLLTRYGAGVVSVPAHTPAVEVWLTFLDPRGLNYATSPAAFGIEFKHFPL